MTKKKYIYDLFNKRSCSYLLTTALLLFFLLPSSFSQNIIEHNTKDTNQQAIHSPKKAAWMSAILPGLGQAYNKKYWKIPVVWASLGGLTYSIVFNNNKYVTYRDAYLLRVDQDSTTIDNFPMFSTNYLQTLKNSYRRNLELSVIITAALYAINIIDATVDAHLYDFDVSDDISLNIMPTMMITDKKINNLIYPGVKLTFTPSNKITSKTVFINTYSIF